MSIYLGRATADRRIIVIGDVHGCFEEMMELVQLACRPSDLMVFLGDLVDRGPKAVETVQQVRKWAEEGRAVCVLGNHEEKQVRYHAHELTKAKTGKPNPMRPLHFPADQLQSGLDPEDWRWLGNLPLHVSFLDGPRAWIATHAGIPVDKPIQDLDKRQFIRTRYLDKETGAYVAVKPDQTPPPNVAPWQQVYNRKESVIHGHIVADAPFATRNRAGAIVVSIDTGCCFGGELTAAVYQGSGQAPDWVRVPARQQYFAAM